MSWRIPVLSTEQDPKVAGAINGPTPHFVTGMTTGIDLRHRLENHATVARIEIDLYEEAGKRYAKLCQQEMEFEADRASQKQAAALRLIQIVNPLSGETQKPYSATAAMDMAALDHEYRGHLKLQADVVLLKGEQRTVMESAKLRAQLALAMLRAEAGVQ
jgi:hypothetical protein